MYLSQRLSFRYFNVDDENKLEELAGDRRIAEMVSDIPHPYPKGLAKEWIVGHAIKREQGTDFIWAICLLETKELVGCIDIKNICDNKGEIGYWIGADFWGKGYASEAVKAMTDYGFSELGLEKICARVLLNNKASQKALINAQFNYIGESEAVCGCDNLQQKIRLYEKTNKKKF